MRNLVQVFEWLYSQSLKIYPKTFRADLGDETQQDWKSEVPLFLRELRTLPVSLLLPV